MLVGEYRHSVDAKGRVFVPAKFRDGLGKRFTLAKCNDACIRAYTISEFERIAEILGNAPSSYAKLKRKILSSAVEVEQDSQCRILIPEKLKAYAGITDSVTFAGVNKYVELWNPETFDAEEISPEEAERLSSELGIL